MKTSGDRQGEVYWVDFGEPGRPEPGYRRPAVVVQNDVFSASNIRTVVICPLTSNLRRAGAPGNVLLDLDDASLSRQSVVNISQIFTVNKRDLAEKIGLLGAKRVREIVSGINVLLEPREAEDAGGWR